MKKLQSDTYLVYVQPKFLTKKECRHYLKKAIGPTSIERRAFAKDREANNAYWHKRLVNMTLDPIVNKVKKFLDKKFNLNLEIAEAQLQNWIKGTYGRLHRHNVDTDPKSVASGYNSLIYLNDDFEGGLFHTEKGIFIKPEPGLLTFFDGRHVFHGTSEVKKKDRFSLIFWWKR